MTTSQQHQSGFAGRPPTNYRYERKFYITGLSRPRVEQIVRLNPAAFSEIFHQRWVNNIYLDTWCRGSYHENLEGEYENRIKSRIRWYGDLFGPVEQPVLEFKIKHGLVNCKEQYPLNSFSVDRSLTIRTLRELFRRANLPVMLQHNVLKLEPALVNRYRRNYFRSADEIVRATIDSDLQYIAVSKSRNRFVARSRDQQGNVLELKYDPQDDRRVSDYTQHFPFRMTRSSKYVMGIERLTI